MPGKSEPEIRKGGLQISENRSFQERFWRVERWAWIFFALILVVAAIGLTGAGGPLSRRTAALPLAQIDYAVISRRQAADFLTIRLAGGSAERKVTFSPEFARSFQIEAIQPIPVRSELGPAGHSYMFATDTDGWSQVVFYVRPQSPSLASFDVQVDGGETIELQSLILP